MAVCVCVHVSVCVGVCVCRSVCISVRDCQEGKASENVLRGLLQELYVLYLNINNCSHHGKPNRLNV